MNKDNVIHHLEKLNKRDQRADLSFLQESFEWALRRRALSRLPLMLWTTPFALATGSGFMGVTETFFEKYWMSTNRDLAWARYYERQANKLGSSSELTGSYNTKAAAHREKFETKYAWLTNDLH